MVYWSLSIFSNFFTLIDWMNCLLIVPISPNQLLTKYMNHFWRSPFILTAGNYLPVKTFHRQMSLNVVAWHVVWNIASHYTFVFFFLLNREHLEIVKVVYCLFLPIYWSVIVKHENLTSFVCSVYVRYLSVFLPAFTPIIVDTLLVVSGFLQSTKFLKL